MKKKNYIFKLMLLLCLVFSLTACSNKTGSNNNGKPSSNEDKAYSMKLYYPTKQYIVDGDDSNKFYEKDIEISDPSNITSEIEGLKNVDFVEDEKEEKEIYPAIPDKLSINSVREENGKYTVDFSSQNLNGSSMEEDILVSSIVNSILSIKNEDGPYAKSVKFTVDGEPSSSLMGHILIEEEIREKITEDI